MPTIGFINGGLREPSAVYVTGFLQGLRETGYVEGTNVAVEYRWAEGQYDELPGMAADLVRRQVAVIVANTPAAPAAKAATSEIPIVFITGGDPVEIGLVSSFNRPGGNATGVTLISGELETKELGLLHELVPAATSIALLVNPVNAGAQQRIKNLQQAARTLGQQVQFLDASTAAEIDSAFTAMAKTRAGALLVVADTFLIGRRDQLVRLSASYAIPTMYQFRDFTVAGGLVSYGASLADQYRQVGMYTGKILKGAKPAELPVLQPTKFELVINLKTAKALGLTVSPSLLARADEVID
jgi:putative ABC transport system substrate-binding protein